MQYGEGVVLEIIRRERSLAMSLFEPRDLTSTLRHYCQCSVSSLEINRLCRETVNVLNKANKKGGLTEEQFTNLKKTGHLLWSHVLAHPIRQKLKHLQGIDLTLFLDEELITIPWELLYNGHNFLCLEFNVGRLVRTNVEKVAQAEYRSLSGTPRMLILANPTNDLKSSYTEGLTIKEELDRDRERIRIDFKSTVIDRMYVKKNLGDYDLVHFAGHCEYDPQNQGNTGWLLADGRFTTTDILSLGSSVSMPSLVFSNGCHSAQASLDLIDADYQQKNYSLASAFLFSGVRHYIGAIRKLEDTVSFDFARSFYTCLLSGKSVGESLRLSRMRIIAERGIKTILWAGYLLYGNPNFTILPEAPASQPPVAGQAAKASASTLRRYLFGRREVVAAVSAAAVIFGIVLAAVLLPAKNPAAYLEFVQVKKLFEAGRNEEAAERASVLIHASPRFLDAYPVLADAYHRLGDKETALKYYYEYALQSEKQDDPKNLARAYSSIGWYYHSDGEYEKAFGFYEKAVEVSRKNRDRLNEAVALRRMAVWHIDKESYDEALKLLTKSSEINRERVRFPEHRYNLACDYFDIGLVFTNMDDYVTARTFYEKSKEIFQRLNLCNELSDCYFNLGELFVYEKQYQKALEYYQEGLMIDTEHKNKANLPSDHLMIGELYVEMERWELAQDQFEKSAQIASQIDARDDLAEAYRALGSLSMRLKDTRRAREYLRQAQEIYYEIDQQAYEEIKKELVEL